MHWWICDWKIFENCKQAAAYYLPQKRAPFFAFFYKDRANTQQMLLVPTGLYHYDKWMVQYNNDKSFNGN